MALLKGRAATPVRPGLVIKSILTGQIPLHTGEYVTEAAITDLHATYKDLIRQENTLRPKVKRLRGMTQFSFKTLFKFAQLLNLVELVREEPMKFPPPGGDLYSLRKTDEVRVVVSTRRVFKITTIGADDEKSWTNLCRAWIEGWPAPQKVEYAVPPTPPAPPAPPAPLEKEPTEEAAQKPVKPPKPPKPTKVAKPFKWVSIPSKRQFGLLLDHLEDLSTAGITSSDVAREVKILSMKLGDWLLWIDDSLEDARAINNTAVIERLDMWSSSITNMMEFLEDDNLEGAIASLREIL